MATHTNNQIRNAYVPFIQRPGNTGIASVGFTPGVKIYDIIKLYLQENNIKDFSEFSFRPLGNTAMQVVLNELGPVLSTVDNSGNPGSSILTLEFPGITLTTDNCTIQYKGSVIETSGGNILSNITHAFFNGKLDLYAFEQGNSTAPIFGDPVTYDNLFTLKYYPNGFSNSEFITFQV